MTYGAHRGRYGIEIDSLELACAIIGTVTIHQWKIFWKDLGFQACKEKLVQEAHCTFVE